MIESPFEKNINAATGKFINLIYHLLDEKTRGFSGS